MSCSVAGYQPRATDLLLGKYRDKGRLSWVDWLGLDEQCPREVPPAGALRVRSSRKRAHDRRRKDGGRAARGQALRKEAPSAGKRLAVAPGVGSFRGWSSPDGVAPALDRGGRPRTLSDKSFGGAFAESESDIFNLAIGGDPKTSRPEVLSRRETALDGRRTDNGRGRAGGHGQAGDPWSAAGRVCGSLPLRWHAPAIAVLCDAAQRWDSPLTAVPSPGALPEAAGSRGTATRASPEVRTPRTTPCTSALRPPLPAR